MNDLTFFGTLRKQPLVCQAEFQKLSFGHGRETLLTVLSSLELQDLCGVFVCSVLKQALSHITFYGIKLAL